MHFSCNIIRKSKPLHRRQKGGARGAGAPHFSLTLHRIVNFSMQICLENLYSPPHFCTASSATEPLSSMPSVSDGFGSCYMLFIRTCNDGWVYIHIEELHKCYEDQRFYKEDFLSAYFTDMYKRLRYVASVVVYFNVLAHSNEQ